MTTIDTSDTTGNTPERRIAPPIVGRQSHIDGLHPPTEGQLAGRSVAEVGLAAVQQAHDAALQEDVEPSIDEPDAASTPVDDEEHQAYDNNSTSSDAAEADPLHFIPVIDDDVLEYLVGKSGLTPSYDSDSGLPEFSSILVIDAIERVAENRQKAIEAMKDKKTLRRAEAEKRLASIHDRKRTKQENLEARIADIETHIEDIAAVVDNTLRQSLVFSEYHYEVGVEFVGECVAEYAKDLDGRKQHLPGRLLAETSSVEQADAVEQKPTYEIVAEHGAGKEAGNAFLSWIVMDGSPVSEEVRSNIVAELVPRRKRTAKRAEAAIAQAIESLSSDEAWSLLKEAFFDQAYEQSVNAHEMFFPTFGSSDELKDLVKGIHLETKEPSEESSTDFDARAAAGNVTHDADRDFDDFGLMIGFEEGVNFEINQVGAGQAGYWMAPLHKEGGYVDTISMIEKYAGSDMASIGSNSFMGLVHASTRMASSGQVDADDDIFKGGYLVLGDRPNIPAFDLKLPKPSAENKLSLPLPSRIKLENQVPQIKWLGTVWHVSSDGFALIKNRLDRIKADPEGQIVPYVNPRDTLEAGYQKIMAVYKLAEQKVSDISVVEAQLGMIISWMKTEASQNRPIHLDNNDMYKALLNLLLQPASEDDSTSLEEVNYIDLYKGKGSPSVNVVDVTSSMTTASTSVS